jgi:hypothetical protein
MSDGYLVFGEKLPTIECHMCHRETGPDRITISQYEDGKYSFYHLCSWNCVVTMATLRRIVREMEPIGTADEGYDI